MFVSHVTIQRVEKANTLDIRQPKNTKQIVFQQIPTI
jgi:hypothetical protein